MSYQSFEQVLQKCHTEEKEFWQVILEDDMAERNVSEEDSMEHMRATWDAMLLAAATYEGNLNSSSGLVGGDGRRMEEYIHSAGIPSLCGEYVDTCIAGALQMGESNACMKRIVAAPTAGACGVLPAVLVPYFQKRCKDTDKILKAMYVAAGIGQIIAAVLPSAERRADARRRSERPVPWQPEHWYISKAVTAHRSRLQRLWP